MDTLISAGGGDADNARYRRRTLILIAVLALARLGLAAVLGLGVDESHYVMYARRLAWGYFDHPPLVALLGIPSRLLGPHTFWVRLGPVLCSTIAMLLLRRLALALGSRERAAWYAVLCLNLMPGFHVMAPALLPDATLNVFWIATLAAAWKALHTRAIGIWLLTGICFGLALLSKYHGVLLPAGLALFVLTHKSYRPWIGRPQPYLAGLTGLLIFLPNIIWNARNDWISYAFQLGHGGGRGELTASNVAEVIGGQLAFAGPVLAGLLVAAIGLIWRDRHRDSADGFLLATCLPVFLFFGLMGSVGKILPHWPFAGWWAGTILVGRILDRRLDATPSAGWRRAWKATVITSGVAVILMYVVLLLPVVPRLYHAASATAQRIGARIERFPQMPPYDPKFDISNDLYGWQDIAQEVHRIHQTQPHPERTFIFCHRFFTTSQIGVYLPRDIAVTSLNRRVDQYRLWFDAGSHRGWDAILVDHDRFGRRYDLYRPLFEGGDPEPIEYTVYRRGFPVHRIRVYRFTGFKGVYANGG